jgi:hypothetical protein
MTWRAGRVVDPRPYEGFRADVDREISAIWAELQVLATSPSLQSGNFREFDQQMRAALKIRGTASTATDLNPPMLDRARSHAGMDRVHWQQADALALPFGEHEFDCVICQFGVMSFLENSIHRQGVTPPLSVWQNGGK